MSKVWYCPKCGYEVTSGGRCHACRNKLVASPLPELARGREEDEVGYRVDGWSDRDRGRLIKKLNDMAILHRFEEDELVVDAEDEHRVDDLVTGLSSIVGLVTADSGSEDVDDLDDLDDGSDEADIDAEPSEGADDWSTRASVRLLADAARRLKEDPTDMQADADVAEASTAVFVVDRFGRADDDTWAAVGRVTRRLLAVLGAEEALEEDIRKEATVLDRLLIPLVTDPSEIAGGPAIAAREMTVYEVSGWLPEQRAHLEVLLDQRQIAHEWDDDDLLVPADRETEVEAVFDEVGRAVPEDDGDEDLYQAVAELFAACGRLAGDPEDPQRSEAVLEWARACEGPPLLGMDEVDWFRIMSRIRTLVSAIETGDDLDLIADEASVVHDLLRAVV